MLTRTLSTGMALAAGSLITSASAPEARAAALPEQLAPPLSEPGGIVAVGYAAAGSTAPLEEFHFQRRGLRPNDVQLEILYCGVCHSDVHTVRNEWHGTSYPCIPGHEIVGRVKAVGANVTRFKTGDIGGVGCLVDSCGECASCKAGLEQYCLHGATGTYNSPEKGTGYTTFGGYSNTVVVTESFVIRIPAGMDLKATAPLLCAGITTFSPLRHWKVTPGQRVGVVGVGGLGHVAIKLAKAQGAHVVMFTSTPAKLADAARLGADEAVLETDEAAYRRMAVSFDFLLTTIPQSFDTNPYIRLLKVDGILVNVGALEPLEPGIDNRQVAGMRRTVAGSLIGGIAETQEVIDFCAAHKLQADVEVIPIHEINAAYERMIHSDVRYRFVIDMNSLSKG
jgi:uncharacterized zinc-type alcohol dehydrogenase-like protein